MWGSIAAAVAPTIIGGLLGGASSGGGQQSQTQTATRDPWGPAQGWLKSNLTSGQNLQDQYLKNPFSGYQANAYGNSQQLSQAARSLLGNLIPQMNGHTGFDRTNPLGRSAPYQFGGAPAQTALAGGLNLGMGGNGFTVDPNAAIAAAIAAAAQPVVVPTGGGMVRQQGNEWMGGNQEGGGNGVYGGLGDLGGLGGFGAYGGGAADGGISGAGGYSGTSAGDYGGYGGGGYGNSDSGGDGGDW